MKNIYTFAYIISLFSFSVLANSASAATYYHNGVGFLNNPESWFTDNNGGDGYTEQAHVLPTAGDAAIIEQGVSVEDAEAYTITYPLSVQGSITFSNEATIGQGGSVSIEQGASTTIGGLIIKDGGSLVVKDGGSATSFFLGSMSVQDQGVFTIEQGGSLNWDMNAHFAITQGGLFNMQAGSTVNFDTTYDLVMDGTMNIANTLNLMTANARTLNGTINVLAGGQLLLPEGYKLNGQVVSEGTVVNQGVTEFNSGNSSIFKGQGILIGGTIKNAAEIRFLDQSSFPGSYTVDPVITGDAFFACGATKGGVVLGTVTLETCPVVATTTATTTPVVPPVVVRDTIDPIIVSITSSVANGAYAPGARIPLIVQFSEPVTSDESIQLKLNNGAMCVVPKITSLTKTATCTYVVAKNQSTARLTVSNIKSEPRIIDAAKNKNKLKEKDLPRTANLGDLKKISIKNK